MRRLEEDRRRAFRYRISLPVWLDDGAQGVTRDVSTCGMYFVCGRAYSLGAVLRLRCSLGETDVHCEGRVVRLERVPMGYGIALELLNFDFS